MADWNGSGRPDLIALDLQGFLSVYPRQGPSDVGARNVATTITALGSMAMGVAATAIVSHAAYVGGQGFIIFLIWAAIAVINIVYARRP